MIPTRDQATSKRLVGGLAFLDFNWTCPVCKRENRWYEVQCEYCRWEEENKKL